MSPAGVETVLYNFSQESGVAPFAGVARDPSGNIYGTVLYGVGYQSAVYKLDPAGRETTLYIFSLGSVYSGSPRAGVVLDSEGNLYGTTLSGGLADAGIVFRLKPAGQEATLYNFPGATGGTNPNGVIRDSAGGLYSTTGHGGTYDEGLVYKLDSSGKQTILYTFTGGADGGEPSPLVRDSAGNLYGVTAGGGTADVGVIFKISTSGQETVLYTFNISDGAYPSGLTLDPSGDLYGTTSLGGADGLGVIFELDKSGNYTVLHSFTGGSDGEMPQETVSRDSAGNFYGTAYYGGTAGYGVVYELSASGQESVLYTFTGGSDGGDPVAGVVIDSEGSLYGTTCIPGTPGNVFKLDTAGNYTVLYSFTGGGRWRGINSWSHPRFGGEPLWHDLCRRGLRSGDCIQARHSRPGNGSAQLYRWRGRRDAFRRRDSRAER